MNDILENFLSTGIKDSKGREIGWIVGLRDDGVNFYAWVQAARKVNYDFFDFGPRQRSVCFTSQKAATLWAYTTAKERITNLIKGFNYER
jgi:hypothetical protein